MHSFQGEATAAQERVRPQLAAPLSTEARTRGVFPTQCRSALEISDRAVQSKSHSELERLVSSRPNFVTAARAVFGFSYGFPHSPLSQQINNSLINYLKRVRNYFLTNLVTHMGRLMCDPLKNILISSTNFIHVSF